MEILLRYTDLHIEDKSLKLGILTIARCSRKEIKFKFKGLIGVGWSFSCPDPILSILNMTSEFEVVCPISGKTLPAGSSESAYLSYHVGKHQASEIFIIKSQKSSFQWCRKLFIAFPFVLLCNARWLIKSLVTPFQLIKIKSEHYPYYFASISDWFKVLFASVDIG